MMSAKKRAASNPKPSTRSTRKRLRRTFPSTSLEHANVNLESRPREEPETTMSSISEVNDDTYDTIYYDAAKSALDRQRHEPTYQGNDAAIILLQLWLATPATADDVERLTDADMEARCRSGISLPARAIIDDRGIRDGMPTSLADVAKRALEVYGGSKTTFTPQHKSANSKTAEFHRVVNVKQSVEHFSNPGDDKEIWHLLEAGTQMFPLAQTWIPPWVTHDNLLYDIRARLLGPKRGSKNTFTDKLSWYLVGDAGAYSPLHFDSHGFGTYLHLVGGELLLMFSNGNETPDDRKIILENIRSTEEIPPEVQAVFKKHMRYVIMRPGQLWYMEPGTLHAVYRNEGTVIVGGHYIPKKRLGSWVEKMKEHLQWYDCTNEDPEDVLKYLDKVLELVSNAKANHMLGDWGEQAELNSLLAGARELIEQGSAWIMHEGWEEVKGQNWLDEWSAKAVQMLKQHKKLLGPET